MTEKVVTICERLMESTEWPRNPDSITMLWTPIKKQLDYTEQINLLICLVQKDYIFKWLRMIGFLLPELSSENPEFKHLLEITIDKVKNDLAQGDLIRGLIKIGESSPSKGIALYSFLNKSENNSLIQYSGLILGGAAKTNFNNAFKIIYSDILDEKKPIKVACLKALRVAFDEKNEEFFNDKIIDILDTTLNDQDLFVQNETIQGYLDFDKYRPERCEQKLLEISRTGNSEAKFTIVNRLWFYNLQNRSKEIEILQICSKDNNINVLQRVAYVLATKGQDFFDESLKIIKGWLKRPDYVSIPNLGYCLKELCKNDLCICQETLKQWSDSDKDPVFRFRINMALQNLAS